MYLEFFERYKFFLHTHDFSKTHYVEQAGLELTEIRLFLPSEYWDEHLPDRWALRSYLGPQTGEAEKQG